MKYKLTLAILVSFLLLGGGIWETIFVRSTFDEMESRVDTVGKKEEYSLEEVLSLQSYWDEKAVFLEITVPHGQLTEISVTLGELVGAVRNEDYDSASALLIRIEKYLDRVGSLYGFSPQNIV